MKKRILLLLVLMFMLTLVACKSRTDAGEPVLEPITDLTEEPLETAPEDVTPISEIGLTYPVVEGENIYPVGDQQDKYPISDPLKQGPKFTIDEPVTTDAKFVTGTGPEDVPIRLVDVSLMGQELGLTTIGDDGKFSFELETKLVSGHSIGLMIGDLSNTDFNYDDFMYSNDYYDKPMIGTIFYIAVVGK